MNTEELFTNKEIITNIADSLEDFPQGLSAKYALWVIGCDYDGDPVEELFIYEFDTSGEATAKAETIDFKFIEEQTGMSIDDYCEYNGINHFSIEIETVIPDPEDEDSTINVGTIYRRLLDFGEDMDAAGLGEYSNVVCVTKKDYELLEDGTLKVSCKLLREFNKNDYVLFEFVDEATPSVLEYKIISKVIYKDGDYYHCELNI